jgi:hypothetical protein
VPLRTPVMSMCWPRRSTDIDRRSASVNVACDTSARGMQAKVAHDRIVGRRGEKRRRGVCGYFRVGWSGLNPDLWSNRG